MASSMAAACTAAAASLPAPHSTAQRPAAQGRLLFPGAPAGSRSLRLRPAGRRSPATRSSPRASKAVVAALADPLKVMIAGAPASGKGTQCELIKAKYGLVHISAGDLLRAEIAAGTENGKWAKEFMEKGQLVPDEIVVNVGDFFFPILH
ncbi:putative adenylate kinase 2, chloroplastic [Dichanthelium oligosanthes]|uniref:adenylate kinase n=1 Tax=Dichanthelium oligosanthes TaxID=888268 RepID=A0A1E5W2L6_9POAL|nr:putative adenylate kinase 2, chloroplastic [Dichanthelium oligosanthes]